MNGIEMASEIVAEIHKIEPRCRQLYGELRHALGGDSNALYNQLK